MLRWTSRIVRATLLVLGIACIAWFPVSRYWAGYLRLTWPCEGAWVESQRGFITIGVVTQTSGTKPDAASFHLMNIRSGGGTNVLPAYARWPEFHRVTQAFYGQTTSYLAVYLPLWLVALTCLAWPVTGLFLARRSRARGFEVQDAADDGDEKPPPQTRAPASAAARAATSLATPGKPRRGASRSAQPAEAAITRPSGRAIAAETPGRSDCR